MIERNFSLKNHNSFGFDVKAKTFFEYSSVPELIEFLDTLPEDERVLHIGSGCNLLFTKDFEGTVLHSAMEFVAVEESDEESVWLRVGSGVKFDYLVEQTCLRNLGGLENLSLIPSEVGAAAVQNIGAYGTELKDVIEEVETLDREDFSRRVFDLEECDYGYRHSIFKTPEFKDRYIITSVLIRLSQNPEVNTSYAALQKELQAVDNPTLMDVRNAVIRIRESKLPNPETLGNAGSFFKNPYCSRSKFEALVAEFGEVPHYEVSADEIKIPAAWLIEQCGFKGRRFGNVGAYEKQPLVLVNYGGAEPSDIVALAKNIEDEVSRRFGLRLEREVIYI